MKKKGKLKLALIILIIISALVGIYIGVCKQKNISMINVFQNLRRLPEDLEGWNLSLLMYDSEVDNGMSAVNNDVWNATNTSEKRVVTVQVNLSNTALAKDYEPGELVITVDSLGKINPTNEAMTAIKAPTTISADLNTDAIKDYDWSYRFDSASQKFIFTNNNLIEFGTTFESTIQMAFEFSAPYVLNGADVTINADLNGELDSVNTLNYKFTSNKQPGSNTLSFSKLNSYDGLGENATDYYWAKGSVKFRLNGNNVRNSLFDTYVDFTVPEGCHLYKSDMTQILPDENDIYKLYESSNGGIYSTYNNDKVFYIAFPKEIYENQTMDLTSSWYGKYKDSYYVKGDPNKELETIASDTKTINLNEYEIVYNGNLYSVSKSSITNRNIAYNRIINENKGETLTYTISGTTIYTGNKYKVRYGDDTLYISNTESGYTKLTDDEYCFKNVYIPGYYTNGNSQSITSGKYDIDLYVRFRGTDSYVKYGETMKNGTSKTITFSSDEFVVGWYIEIYDLEESLKVSSSISTYVYIQKSSGLSETGKIYNFDYLQVFNKVEDEYVLVNQPEISSYNTFNTVTTELAENDIINYGVYLQRNYASKEYGNDYEYYYMDYGMQNSRYDNNYFYRDVYIRPYLDSYSTGTDAFDGYNLYTIIPEGAELNATKEELFDLITKYNNNSFVNKSYKPDGTQFTTDEMYSFLKEHLTITIDTNYQDTGKTWIWFKEDFGDITFDTYDTANYNAYFPIQYNIPIKVPYESYFTHGASYSIKNYISPLKDNETFSYNKSTDTNDIDNDGDRTDYYSLLRSTSTTIVPAVSSYQEASKNVWTENSENRYVSEFAVAKNGGDYKYKLKVRTGSNEITNLMIYDNLENASNDWKGTFVGIDTSFTNSQGFNPTLYVSDDRNAGTLEDDATNWRLYDSSADNSEVKSVAIDYGNAVIPAGFLTFVEVEMKAPEDPNIKTLAKNISYTKWNAIDLNGNVIDNVEGVTGNVVNVGLGKTEHDIVVQKVWNDNNNEHHVRPSSVIVHLLRNNIDIDQIELNEINNWTHTFNNLQIYDDEYNKYEYTIIENPVNLYTPSVQYEELAVDSMSRTFTITNTINEDELFKDIVGDKIWQDNNNARGRRPSSVTIDLYRDGTKIDTTTTDSNNDWYYEFTHLPKWKNNTEEYNYTISEVEDEHYSVTYDSGLYPARGAKLKFSADSRTQGASYDYVGIYYKWRNQVYRIGNYGGTTIANKEITIPTNDFYIYWRTNGSNHDYYGFSIDSITPINYEGDIIGTAMSLPNYTPEEISGNVYPESEHVYSDNINQMWHYTLDNPLYTTKNSVNITNTYKLIPSTVLVHHYIIDTTTSLVPDETIDGFVWDSYTTSPSSGIPTYYKLVSMPSNATGEFAATQTVVTYYYELKDYPYRIEYYYDGIIDSSKTETDADTYGVSINTYDDKVIAGYRFDHDSGKPLTITENEDTNVIKVYYVKRSDLSYIVHYKEQGSNATLAEDKEVNNKTFLEEVTENAIDISGYNKVNPTTQTITIQVSGNEMIFYYTKRNDLSYTVHYKEQGSNTTLAEDKVVNNKTYLEEVTENAIDISGYDKVNPTTQTITMQVSGNEMTFFYTKRTDLSYTVHYKEQGSNETLSEDKVVNNKTYLEEVTENAIDISGYDKVNPTTQTITMQVSGNEMTFFYTKRTDLSYTVHYKEQGSNATLSEDKGENNKTYLEEITENAIEINGYNKINPTTQTITMQVSGNEITFYYTKRTDLSYTVHYKEQGSNTTLSDDKVIDNQVFGNVVNELPIVIDGYDIVNPEAAQIEITTGINEHTFYYTKRTDLNYTVYYKEQGTNRELADEKFIDNKTYLEEITENAIDIEGYNKVNPTTQTITIQPENNEIIFYYTKRNDLNYVVHYKEQGSEETLARDKVKSNRTYLEEITENAIDIDGYNKVNPTSQTITIRLSGNEMTFYYTKRTDLSYTVHYKEQGTNEKVAEDKVINNQEFGSIANETALDISGYRKLDPTSANILITSGTNEYTFYYEKDNYNYTVEYYYNNIIDESKTDVISASYNNEITTFELKPKIGYKFDRAEGTPLTITTNEDTNLIKVFYKIDEEQRKDLHYTVVYFKDNILIPEDTVEKTESVQVLEDDLIRVDESLYTDEDKYDGYTINCTKPSMVPEKVENDTIIHVFYIPDQTLRKELKYTVEYYKDGVLVEEDTQHETESVQILQPDLITVHKENINTTNKYENYVFDYTSPRNIPDRVETDSTIKIYYVRRSDLQYTVHYKEQGTNKIIAEDKVVKNQTYGDTVEETAIDIKGYDKVNPITAEIEITTGANEYTFYYNRSKFKYTVEHYYENIIDDSKTDTIEATYLDEITTYTEKPKVGYMVDRAEGTPLTISANEDENVIKVYYEKDPSQTKTLKYTVNYYKDGYIQKNDTQIETQEVQVLSDNILNVDKSKINIIDKYEDYTFEKIEPSEIPDTIEDGGIIEVFYNKTKHPYTIEYYYNNIIDNDVTESGQAYTNDVINTYTNKDKEGYEFDDVDGLPLIISSTEENIIKVYYLPIRKITINHIDKNTNEVIKTEERTGKEGYTITTGAEDFEGYICVEKPEVEKYTYIEDEQIVNYYYARLSSGVIEKHIDLISGKLIADDVHYDGYEGKEYTTSIKDIENYKHASNKQYYRALIEKDSSMLDGSDASTVDEYLEKQGIDADAEYIPANYTGIMTDDLIEVRYYYVPNTKLIVKYVDISTGEEIIKSVEKDTMLDEEYTTFMQEIDEYIPIKNKVYYKNYFINHPNELKDETVEEYMTKNNIDPESTYRPNNSEGTMTVIINQDNTYSNETIVTYYYSKVREVVIKYYDIITGKEISEEIIKAGPDGDLYDISDTKKEIEGYTIVEVPESQSGIYQEHNETRNYYYAKNTQVVVKYVDKDTGKEIAKSQTIDGYVGKGYTTEKENVDGYYYLTSTDNTSGKMTEDSLEVIYYYNKPKYSSCTINYLDTETGKPIKESKVITDQKVETTIYAKALIIDIANYTFDHFDKDSIIIKEGENTINLYYTKNEEPKKEPTKQELKIITVKIPEEKPVVKEPDNSVRISNTGKSTYIDKVLGTILIFTGCVIIIVSKIRDIHNKRKE